MTPVPKNLSPKQVVEWRRRVAAGQKAPTAAVRVKQGVKQRVRAPQGTAS